MDQPSSDPPSNAEQDARHRAGEEADEHSPAESPALPPNSSDSLEPPEPRSLFADLDPAALGALSIDSAAPSAPEPASEPVPPVVPPPPYDYTPAPPAADEPPAESASIDVGIDNEAGDEATPEEETDLAELEAVVAAPRDRHKLPRKRKRSPLLVAAAYLVLLVMIAALAVVGYDLFRQYTNQQPAVATVSPSPSLSPSPPPAGEAPTENRGEPPPVVTEEPAAAVSEPETPAPPPAESVAPAPPPLAPNLPEAARAEAEALQHAIMSAPLEPNGIEASHPAPGETAAPATEPLPPAEADPAIQEAFRQATTAAREALARRNLVVARRQLAAAEAQVQTPEERAELDRLGQIAVYLEQFWQAVRMAVTRLKPLDELPVQNSRVVVVQVAGEQLTVRTAARNYTFVPANMHHNLVLALADRGLADSPDRDVLLGTYLAFAPGGDRAEARRLWEQAATRGVEVASLLPELDLAPPVGAAVAADGAGNRAEQVRAAPPDDEAALRAAAEEWRTQLAAEYQAAEKPGGKPRLVRRLLAAAKADGVETVPRYAALREALRMAAEAGEPALASQAIRELAAAFVVDEGQLKLESLETLVDNARGAADHRQIAQESLALAKSAAADGREDDVDRLLTIAEAAAHKSGSRTLLEQARAARAQFGVPAPEPE